MQKNREYIVNEEEEEETKPLWQAWFFHDQNNSGNMVSDLASDIQLTYFMGS